MAGAVSSGRRRPAEGPGAQAIGEAGTGARVLGASTGEQGAAVHYHVDEMTLRGGGRGDSGGSAPPAARHPAVAAEERRQESGSQSELNKKKGNEDDRTTK